MATHYTIPKIKRELKLAVQTIEYIRDYTIPKIKRELKPTPLCDYNYNELYHTKN